MIPLVEDRQFRECKICFAFVPYSGKNGDLCGVHQSPIKIVRGGGDGCLLHYTVDEMLEKVRDYQELINSGGLNDG